MTLSPRDRRAVLLGGGTILLVVVYLYALSPWLASWSAARADVETAAINRAAADTDRARAAAILRQLGAYYGGGLATPLPPVAEVRVGFVKTVQELLKSNGLESKDLRSQPLQPIRETPGIGLVALEVECQGPVSSLMKTLAKLGQADRPIVVQRLRTEPDPQRPDQMRVSMTLATFAKLEATP